EGEAMRPLCIQHANGARFCAIAADHVPLPDVDLGSRNPRDVILGQTQCLRQHPAVQPAHPVAQAECSVLSIQSVIEGKDGVARPPAATASAPRNSRRFVSVIMHPPLSGWSFLHLSWSSNARTEIHSSDELVLPVPAAASDRSMKCLKVSFARPRS